ncbi:MAG: hypothetical protein K8823_1229 [Cenarchaeum symbiont of Oopsacas minuta]|nr:hypothetical protein [Cenarchaeum symbiont of Oopsacas minuta]
MSGTERHYQKSIDDMILAATGKELKRLQRIDIETQKNGSTFYESYAMSDQTFEKLSTRKNR